MRNLKFMFLEVRLEIILFILGKLESFHISLNDEPFAQFRNLLLEEKVVVENQLMK